MESNEDAPILHTTKPKIVGLTGGIGTGKTTVANFLQELGYPVYSSDIRAKQIVNEDFSLKEKIVEILGNQAYDEAGNYNRKYVAEKVFEDANLLSQLNSIIHPAVRKDFEKWVTEQHALLIFKETALLFELGLEKDCTASILVTADEHLRIKRVMDRDHKTYREVENIMSKQMPEKEKMKRADYIIYNNSDLEVLKYETEKVIEKINMMKS